MLIYHLINLSILFLLKCKNEIRNNFFTMDICLKFLLKSVFLSFKILLQFNMLRLFASPHPLLLVPDRMTTSILTFLTTLMRILEEFQGLIHINNG